MLLSSFIFSWHIFVHPPFPSTPLIAIFLARDSPLIPAAKFFKNKAVPPIQQAFCHVLTNFSSFLLTSSSFFIVSLSFLLISKAFSGETFIALFSIPTCKLKLDSAKKVCSGGFTITFATFLMFISTTLTLKHSSSPFSFDKHK